MGKRMGGYAAAGQEDRIPQQVRCRIFRKLLRIHVDLGEPAKKPIRTKLIKDVHSLNKSEVATWQGPASPNPPEGLPDAGGADAMRAFLQVSHDDMTAPSLSTSKQRRGVKRKLNDSPEEGTGNFPFIFFWIEHNYLFSQGHSAFRHLAAFEKSSACAHGILSMI